LTHLLNQYSKLTTKDTIAAIKLAVIIDMPSMLKDMMYTNMVIITTIITTFMTFQMKNDMSYYRFDWVCMSSMLLKNAENWSFNGKAVQGYYCFARVYWNYFTAVVVN